MNRQAGFAGLEMLGAMLAFMLLMPMLYALWDTGMTEMKKRAVAQHLVEVTDATISYGRKHYNALLEQSTKTSGPTISIANLITDEFLIPGFQPLNPWRQSYTIYSRQPKTGELQLVILTQGGLAHEAQRPKFGNVVVPSTAALAKAGFMPVGGSGHLQGAYNAWKLDLASLGIPAPAPGHLGAVSNLSSFDVGHDYLYRVDVPGHPELNEMWTELDMTDHAIERVKEVQFVPHTLDDMDNFCADPSQNGRFFLHENEGLYVCRDGKVQTVADTGNSLMLKTMTLASHGTRIPKPSCPPGVNTTPEIFVSPMSVGAGAKGAPIVGMQSWATSLSATEWQVHLRVLTDDPSLGTQQWINPPPEYGQMMVLTLCKGDVKP